MARMTYEKRWHTLRVLGGGGQGTVHLAVDVTKMNLEIDVYRRSRTPSWRCIRSRPPDDHRTAVVHLLEAVSQYLRHDSASVCGALKVLNATARTDKARARMEREGRGAASAGRSPHHQILDASVPTGGS